VGGLGPRRLILGVAISGPLEPRVSPSPSGGWTYRVVAKHVVMLERDSLQSIAADRAGRKARGGDA
jgi:hypothetical protein